MALVSQLILQFGTLLFIYTPFISANAGSQAIRHSDGGGVYKRQPTSPTARSVKKLTKKSLPTQQECISQLKSLLPRTTNEEEISEVSLLLEIGESIFWCQCLDTLGLLCYDINILYVYIYNG